MLVVREEGILSVGDGEHWPREEPHVLLWIACVDANRPVRGVDPCIGEECYRKNGKAGECDGRGAGVPAAEPANKSGGPAMRCWRIPRPMRFGRSPPPRPPRRRFGW